MAQLQVIYTKLALLTFKLATAFFVDDAVTYRVAPMPVTFDAATGVAIVSVIPDIPIGCDTPRLTFDTATETLLAVHSLDADSGAYFPYNLLAE